MNKINGFLYGLLSSACFGLIPLFTLPLMQAGMRFESILLYRFVFSCLALGAIALLTRQNFQIARKDIPSLLVLAGLYDISAIFLFWGYKLMSSGVATTIHFMYPVLTTLLMMVFFGEKKSSRRLIAVSLAVFGVWTLSHGEGTGDISLSGTLIVLLSALAYAMYIITVNQLKIRKLQGVVLTFYVFLFGGMLLGLGLFTWGDLQPIENWNTVGNLTLLALVPTVISNLALVQAVKGIGSTLTSVLGAMEPVTAVCVGIFIFDEAFTLHIGSGIALIIAAVLLIIWKR
ncbi:MAG: DMT family transporter [Bacteroides sp.]|nr:DMT family transporter [Bacteroides sp.]